MVEVSLQSRGMVALSSPDQVLGLVEVTLEDGTVVYRAEVEVDGRRYVTRWADPEALRTAVKNKIERNG